MDSSDNQSADNSHHARDDDCGSRRIGQYSLPHPDIESECPLHFDRDGLAHVRRNGDLLHIGHEVCLQIPPR